MTGLCNFWRATVIFLALVRVGGVIREGNWVCIMSVKVPKKIEVQMCVWTQSRKKDEATNLGSFAGTITFHPPGHWCFSSGLSHPTAAVHVHVHAHTHTLKYKHNLDY